MHRNKWVMGIIFLVFFGSLYSIFFENGEFVKPFDSGNPKKRIKLGLDLQGGMHLLMEVDEKQLPKGLSISEAVDRAVEVIRNRVDSIGVSEPLIQKEGEKWIVVQLPGVKDPDAAKTMIGQTALLEFKLLNEKSDDLEKALDGKVLPEDQLLYDKEKKPFLLKKEQLLTGAALASAKMSMGGGSLGSEISVDFSLTEDGSKQFAVITGKNIGKRLAIILDDLVFDLAQARVAHRRLGKPPVILRLHDRPAAGERELVQPRLRPLRDHRLRRARSAHQLGDWRHSSLIFASRIRSAHFFNSPFTTRLSASATVGISGAPGLRFNVVTASVRSLPERTREIAAGIVTNNS